MFHLWVVPEDQYCNLNYFYTAAINISPLTSKPAKARSTNPLLASVSSVPFLLCFSTLPAVLLKRFAMSPRWLPGYLDGSVVTHLCIIQLIRVWRRPSRRGTGSSHWQRIYSLFKLITQVYDVLSGGIQKAWRRRHPSESRREHGSDTDESGHTLDLLFLFIYLLQNTDHNHMR